MLACQNCSVRFCSFHVEELHRARSLVRIDPIGIKLKKFDKFYRAHSDTCLYHSGRLEHTVELASWASSSFSVVRHAPIFNVQRRFDCEDINNKIHPEISVLNLRLKRRSTVSSKVPETIYRLTHCIFSFMLCWMDF